jgi:hypothetical protein
MKIVPEGSSGKILRSFLFLRMTREIGLLGGTFYQDFDLLDRIDEAK